MSKISFNPFVESSLAGIMYFIPVGFVFVSQIAIIGIFRLRASFIAVISFLISQTNKASGTFVRETNPPTFSSSFSMSLSNSSCSFFVYLESFPAAFWLTRFVNLLIDFLTTVKLVRVPPIHFSVTYGISISVASFLISSLH